MKKNKLARFIQSSVPTLLLFASSKAGAATIQMALTLPLAATSGGGGGEEHACQDARQRQPGTAQGAAWFTNHA